MEVLTTQRLPYKARNINTENNKKTLDERTSILHKRHHGETMTSKLPLNPDEDGSVVT